MLQVREPARGGEGSAQGHRCYFQSSPPTRPDDTRGKASRPQTLGPQPRLSAAPSARLPQRSPQSAAGTPQGRCSRHVAPACPIVGPKIQHQQSSPTSTCPSGRRSWRGLRLRHQELGPHLICSPSTLGWDPPKEPGPARSGQLGAPAQDRVDGARTGQAAPRGEPASARGLPRPLNGACGWEPLGQVRRWLLPC